MCFTSIKRAGVVGIVVFFMVVVWKKLFLQKVFLVEVGLVFI
jgi:hypothetical protein